MLPATLVGVKPAACLCSCLGGVPTLRDDGFHFSFVEQTEIEAALQVCQRLRFSFLHAEPALSVHFNGTKRDPTADSTPSWR